MDSRYGGVGVDYGLRACQIDLDSDNFGLNTSGLIKNG